MLSYRTETVPKVEDWNWDTIFYGHYKSIFYCRHIRGLKIY